MRCEQLFENVSDEYIKQKEIIEDLINGKIDGTQANKLILESLAKVDSLIEQYSDSEV